jgi:hypothetical protein
LDSVKSVDNSIIGFSAKESIDKVESDSKTIECEKDAKKDWEKEDNQQKKRCCDWDEAYSYKSYENAIKFIKEQIRDREKQCPDYGYNSTKCDFPVWIIILTVLWVVGIIAAIIAAIITFIVFFVIKKKRQTRSQN